MSDEIERAQKAQPGGDTIFGKIIRGEIPTDFIHRDEKCIVIRDINPQAPVHLLVIPIKPIVSIEMAEDDDQDILGHLMLIARDMAKKEGLGKGYRLIINNGRDGGQSVYHLHVHVMGGRPLGWPPG